MTTTHHPKPRTLVRHLFAAGLLGGLLIAALPTAQAQISTATLKGVVSQAKPGTQIIAVNKANGNSYRATVLADGSYVLIGLAPGQYRVQVSGAEGKGQEVELQVGQTASLDLSMVNNQLERVEVQGNAARLSIKDTQLGTVVSSRMLEALPQSTRNFMSAVDLAPGVAFDRDGGGNARIQAGSQSYNNVNVFVDGVGQKNNILTGGVVGQDSSRGNPFPQSAIAEYKVLGQNYKAEYEQLSSAAITAVTKSGTNELHGSVYFDRTGTNWRAKTPDEKTAEAAGVAQPPSHKYEYGFSVGGPIKEDVMHFFVAYDGKQIQDSRQVVPQNLDKLPSGQGIVPSLVAAQGNAVDDFKEHLLFAKLDAQLNADNKLTLSTKLRREKDHLPEDRKLSAPSQGKDRANDETSVDLKHEYINDTWLSEARAGFETYTWNPHSPAGAALVKYKVSTAPIQALEGSQDVLFLGGSPDAQLRKQSGAYWSEDLTYTGLAKHVIKGGVKFKAMKYDLQGTSRQVDVVETLIDRTTGNPYYDGKSCTGTNVASNGLQSLECKINPAESPQSVSYRNNQLGIYLQDDWSVTPRLDVSYGARWDYESNMLNNSYVTPADRVAALTGPDTRTDVLGMPVTVPAGQTYAQSLAKGGINIQDYIATGNSRKAYKGALAPRLGFAYDLTGKKDTVLFGGWGRTYDRTLANITVDERIKNLQPGGEIWLIKNDFKMPYADQASLGIRNVIAQDWGSEVALSYIDARNQFEWFSGNRDPNGGFGPTSTVTPLWNGPAGYGSLILGDFIGHNKTTALLVKLDKAYTRSSGWGVNVAYTYSDAKTTHRDWNNDLFDWTAGRPGTGWHTSKLVDKHRLVVAGVSDNLLPWNISLSGKLTLASGMPRRQEDCPAWPVCTTKELSGRFYRQLDLSFVKEFKINQQAVGVRADILNVFNTVGRSGDYLTDFRGDVRTVRLGATYSF